MTATEQKEFFRQALALPLKARLDLYYRLVKSLESPVKKGKVVRDTKVLAEQAAVYGRNKAPKRAKAASPKAEVLSKKEWNEVWKTELEKRIEEVDSGKVKCIPYSEVRKEMDRILGRS